MLYDDCMFELEQWQAKLLEDEPSQEISSNSVEWLVEHVDEVGIVCNAWAEQATQTAQQEQWMGSHLSWQDQQRLVASRLTSNLHFPTPEGFVRLAYPSAELKTAAALNLLGSCRSRRKDGKLYTFHPMFVDFLISIIRDLPEDVLETTRIAALLHDFLDEDMVRVFMIFEKNGVRNDAYLKPDYSLTLIANLKQAREDLNSGPYARFAIGDLALELIGPLLASDRIPEGIDGDEAAFFNQARIIFWLNWRTQGHPHYRSVKIADKIHDSSDLGYILNNQDLSQVERDAKLAAKFAKIFFSATCLNLNSGGELQPDVPSDLWELFITLFRKQLDSYNVDTSPDSVFAQQVSGYYTAYRSYHHIFIKECREYATQVGLPDLPDIT